MRKAKPLDRALLHGLHLRLAEKPDRISQTALLAVVRVAESYTQGIREAGASPDDVADFYEDALLLLEILTQALRQAKAVTKASDAERDSAERNSTDKHAERRTR